MPIDALANIRAFSLLTLAARSIEVFEVGSVYLVVLVATVLVVRFPDL